MIKTDRQLAQTREQIARFEAAAAALESSPPPKGVSNTMHEATLAANQHVVERLRIEIAEYEALKAGDVALAAPSSLAEVPRALIQMRIARGLTQRALAERLSVAEQQVQRWEQREYENVGFENLLDVAEALGFDLKPKNAQASTPAAARRPTSKQHPTQDHRRYVLGSPTPAWPAGTALLVPVLQKAHTYNQTACVQFSYLAGEKHRRLKQALSEGKPEKDLLKHYKALVNYLNDAFQMAVAHNVRFLLSTFSGRSHGAPRVCLKGNELIKHQATRIVPLFRERPVPYKSDVDISGNTGFSEIARTGNYYIENNIPAAVLRGEYVNPRLDAAKIRDRYKTHTAQALSSLSEEWRRYWRDGDLEAADPRAFYRSTLIMPLKLWDNQISPEFDIFLRKRDIDTRIFGYLCLDHFATDYFDPAIDLNMTKIFADTLCTMLLLHMNFTTLSRTTRKVRHLKLIAEWEESEAGAMVEGLKRPALSKMSLSGLPTLDTEKPELVEMDQALMKSLRILSPAD